MKSSSIGRMSISLRNPPISIGCFIVPVPVLPATVQLAASSR
jgi:hypothetical protein